MTAQCFRIVSVALVLLNLLSTQVRAQAPRLTIDRSGGVARLGIGGEPGGAYTVEAALDALDGQWEPLITAAPTNQFWSWLDSASAQAPRRFYRVSTSTNAGPAALATDFRLIDHLGRAHHLEYALDDPAVRAVVLIFTANDCPQVDDALGSLKSLRDQFASQGVEFWMIDSMPSDTRSNIAAAASAQAIDLPILADPAQVVAREYGATAATEIQVLTKSSDGGRGEWTVGYRGAVDDRTGASPIDATQYYLSNALAAAVSDHPIIIMRSQTHGCAIPLPLPRPEPVSYSDEIAPMLAGHCVRCHSPGNIAPWSMTNYDIVHAYAPLIKDEVLAEEMPPWFADPYYGAYSNDFSLNAEEKARLVQWINDGAPRGEGPDPLLVAPPPPTNYPFAWPASLGPPDLVLTVPTQAIPATGEVDYRYLDVPTGLATDAWVRAAVILPGNTRAVHHALAFFGSDAIFKGLLGFFAIYIPGYQPLVAPEGTAKLLPKATVLQAQMHYVTTGQADVDQTRIGLYFSSTPPQSILQTKSAWNINFVIPPGAPETQIKPGSHGYRQVRRADHRRNVYRLFRFR